MSSSPPHQQQPPQLVTTLADIRWMEPMGTTEATNPTTTSASLLNGRHQRMLAWLGTGRVGQYVQRLVTDYATSCKDIAVGMRQRPLRAIAYGSALASLIFTCKSNPDEAALRARLAQFRQQMLLIPASIHNTRAGMEQFVDKRLEQYTNLLNGNRLELVDFLFFTLLVERKFDKRNNFYAANDTTTRDWPWTELWLNTQDIGAFGRFWILERSFENCDICQEEWESPEATKH